VIIRRNHFHHVTASGILGYGERVVFDGNVIHHCGDDNNDIGTEIAGRDLVFTNNVWSENRNAGLEAGGLNRSTISNNVFFRNGKDGITIWDYSSGLLIQNNIFYDNRPASSTGTQGVSLYGAEAGGGHVFRNNLFFSDSPGRAAIADTHPAMCRTWERGRIEADPRFVDTMGFRLRPDSPAKDTGERSNAPVQDFWGTKRPAGMGVDIGIHEL
jgi:parallel beta-helix repeat protein